MIENASSTVGAFGNLSAFASVAYDSLMTLYGANGLKFYTGAVYMTLNTSGALGLPAYTTAGLLVNDSSGNVTTEASIATATTPGNFSANHRLPVNIAGTTYYIPLDTATW
jgi:hypothetical protein